MAAFDLGSVQTPSFLLCPRMTRVDLRNYLERIYNVPVAAVRTRVQYGSNRRRDHRNIRIKKPDYKVAYVQLVSLRLTSAMTLVLIPMKPRRSQGSERSLAVGGVVGTFSGWPCQERAAVLGGAGGSDRNQSWRAWPRCSGVLAGRSPLDRSMAHRASFSFRGFCLAGALGKGARNPELATVRHTPSQPGSGSLPSPGSS
uniref:Large ribosomal subunit protein uL23m n=1 Tax=Sus scrofa TaxID=9823 RepID=A0A4X1U666_PIG